MKNQILGVVALGVLGSCNSEPKQQDEIGRYVPIGTSSVLDSKKGIVYSVTENYSETIFTEYYVVSAKKKTSTIIKTEETAVPPADSAAAPPAE
jgi:hypothetical protein